MNGGGVYTRSQLTLRNCKITQNHTQYHGGGVYSIHDGNTLDNCEICYNYVDNTLRETGKGAGIKFSKGINILNCTIHNNYAQGLQSRGGAICGGSILSYFRIANSEIYDNHASEGGALYLLFGNINNCHIYNNASTQQAGGAYLRETTVTNCDIHNNTTAGDGGGAQILNSQLYNCNFYNNSTTDSISRGSGIYLAKFYNSDNDSKLINCNIVNNSATGATSAVYIDCDSNAFLTNCVIWGNRDNGNSPQVDNVTNEVSITYCAIEGGFDGEGNISLATENNGDDQDLNYVNFVLPTSEVGAENEDECNWALDAGSACIDAGTPDTTGLNLPAIDLLGNDRIINNRIDMGAIEYLLGSAIDEYVQSNSLLTIYPNPASNHCEIMLSNNDDGIAKVEVYDLMGRMMIHTEGTSLQYNNTLNISALTPSTYIVRIFTHNGNVLTGKLIVQ